MMEKLDTILKKLKVGLWVIEMNEHAKPRMYINNTLKDLFGISDNLTPEKTYTYWYNRIFPNDYDAVSENLDKLSSGLKAEVLYLWSHPVNGVMYIRLGGICDSSYTDGLRIEGYCQDVTEISSLGKDSLTGLYTKEVFFEMVQEILNKNPNVEYRIMVSDIVNFKMVNEKYGIETGDKLLKYLADAAKNIIPDNFIIGARINADKFAYLQYAKKQSHEEGMHMAETIKKNAPITNFVWKHGIYYTEFDRTISIQTMCDHAFQAVNSIKGKYDVDCAVYGDHLRHELLLHQQIEDSMEKALEQNQFTVLLQPKQNLHTNTTGGAEALVRWVHPTAGFMNPDTFIPLFEKNGFIQKLDKYVLNKVCQILRRWLDEGKPVIPISINLSRCDFDLPDLDTRIVTRVDSYQLPHYLVHLEITESIFSSNP